MLPGFLDNTWLQPTTCPVFSACQMHPEPAHSTIPVNPSELVHPTESHERSGLGTGLVTSHARTYSSYCPTHLRCHDDPLVLWGVLFSSLTPVAHNDLGLLWEPSWVANPRTAFVKACQSTRHRIIAKEGRTQKKSNPLEAMIFHRKRENKVITCSTGYRRRDVISLGRIT